MKYYTVYREETEEITAFGNAVQCEEIIGLKNTCQFFAFVSKTRSGLRKHHKEVVEETDKNEEQNIRCIWMHRNIHQGG